MLCGIFTSRWVLMSLGQEDFGLYGLIGGLTMFVTFINGTLASAVARYYTVTIGAVSLNADKQAGIEESRRWFSLAVILHFTVATILVAVGYPIGAWAIENWLNIPSERVAACIWVLRYATFASYIAMVNVPYSAMYTAKQYIAELTVYSLVSTISNIVFVYYMVNHSGDWLIKYSFAMCLTASIPQMLICLRARHVFQECRFKVEYCFDVVRIRQLCSFALWQMFGTVSMLIRCEALSIITNKAFGAKYNSSMSIATLINSQSGALSASMYGAFSPVIMTTYGKKDYSGARLFSQRACKFATCFFLLFSLPLMLEMQYVLDLWLVDPPPFCSSVCILVLIGTIFEQSVCGTNALVSAKGNIRGFQMASGVALLLTVPVSLILLRLTNSFLSMPVTIVIVAIILMGAKLLYARRLVAFSLREWVFKIAMPIGIVAGISLLPGIIIGKVFQPSFYRLMLTSGTVISFMLLMSWSFLLSRAEKGFLVRRVQNYVGHMARKTATE